MYVNRMTSGSWLLLLYGLPTHRNAERVSLWRKLKTFGALQLKTSAYLLPDEPVHFERFQWLAKQVRDADGDSTLIRVTQIEGLSNEQIIGLFNDARAGDYSRLMGEAARFIARHKKRPRGSFEDELEKLNARLNEIREVDYFHCPRSHDAEMLLKRAGNLLKPKGKSEKRLDRKEYQGKTWLTRPRPEIDRVGSAWLIRRFIDLKARFIFAASAAAHPEAIPYDMADVELTHQGEDCTFETLLKRFDIRDTAAQQIGEMIHDADIEDDKFQRPDCIGLDRVFKGLARLGRSDKAILAKGFECFDALYASMSR
jgi:hypothetical protein